MDHSNARVLYTIGFVYIYLMMMFNKLHPYAKLHYYTLIYDTFILCIRDVERYPISKYIVTDRDQLRIGYALSMTCVLYSVLC